MAEKVIPRIAEAVGFAQSVSETGTRPHEGIEVEKAVHEAVHKARAEGVNDEAAVKERIDRAREVVKDKYRGQRAQKAARDKHEAESRQKKSEEIEQLLSTGMDRAKAERAVEARHALIADQKAEEALQEHHRTVKARDAERTRG